MDFEKEKAKLSQQFSYFNQEIEALKEKIAKL